MEATLGGYGPVEKTYHMCRRRRWVRNRKVVKDVSMKAEEVSNIHANLCSASVYTASLYTANLYTHIYMLGMPVGYQMLQ